MSLPAGWGQTSLGELFTEEQLRRVMELWRAEYPDDYERAKAFGKYFETIGDQMAAKGLTPKYASFAIPYLLDRHVEQ